LNTEGFLHRMTSVLFWYYYFLSICDKGTTSTKQLVQKHEYGHPKITVSVVVYNCGKVDKISYVVTCVMQVSDLTSVHRGMQSDPAGISTAP